MRTYQSVRPPIWIRILAIFHLLIGILVLFVGIALIGGFVRFATLLRLPWPLLMSLVPVVTLIIPSLLAFISGVGLLRVKRWGWWLGILFHGYSGLANFVSFLFSIRDTSQFALSGAGWNLSVVSYALPVIIHVVVVLYLLRQNVRLHFKITDSSSRRLVSTSLATASGLLACVMVLFDLPSTQTWIHLSSISLIHAAAERHTPAVDAAEQALEFCEGIYGPEHPNTAAAMNLLAIMYHRQGRYDDPGPLYQKALNIMERTYGLDHPAVTITLGHLAEFYFFQGKFEAAEALYVQQLNLIQHIRGSNDPAMAETLDRLGLLYQVQKRYQEAEPLHSRSIEILESFYSPTHTRVAITLNYLAELYKAQGNFAAAEPLYQRAISIREQVLGKSHTDVAIILDNYANLLRTTGKDKEAQALENRSASIWGQARRLREAKGKSVLGI